MVARAALLLGLGLAASGCVSSPGGDAPRIAPTLVAVAPEDFLGQVPCVDAPGGLRSYVVRLYDHGTTEEPLDFELPASVVRDNGGVYRPVPCEQTAAFGHVVPGHKYSAVVDAYDRTDLRAQGPGSAILLDPDGNYVAPRWTTRCGRDASGAPAAGATISAFAVTRFVRGCEPLAPSGPETPTQISVSLDGLASPDACGSGPGLIERFSVRPEGDPGAALEASCGGSVTFGSLVPQTGYAFELQTFESGATIPLSGTTCFRVAQYGATVPAACDPLATTGTVAVDLGALLAAWGQACGPDGNVESITATLDTEVKSTPCTDGSLRFDGKAPGSYSVGISSSLFGDVPGPAAVCAVEVEPGLVATAICTPIPA